MGDWGGEKEHMKKVISDVECKLGHLDQFVIVNVPPSQRNKYFNKRNVLSQLISESNKKLDTK